MCTEGLPFIKGLLHLHINLMQPKSNYSGFTVHDTIWDTVYSHPYSYANTKILRIPWWSCDLVVPSLILPLMESPCKHRYFNRPEFLRADSMLHSQRLVMMLEVLSLWWIHKCGLSSVEFVILVQSDQGESIKILCVEILWFYERKTVFELTGRQSLSWQEGEMYSSAIAAKPGGLVVLTLPDTDIWVFYCV